MERKIKVISMIGTGYLGKQIIEKSLLFNYDIKAFDVNKEDLGSFTEKTREKIKENISDKEIEITQLVNAQKTLRDVTLNQPKLKDAIEHIQEEILFIQQEINDEKNFLNKNGVSL